MKHLREPAILIALYMAPGLVATVGGNGVPAQAGALLSVTLRNLAFLLLLLYLLDIRGERATVLSLHGPRLRAIPTVVGAVGVAGLLFCLSVLTGLTATAIPGIDNPVSAATGAIVAGVRAQLPSFLVVPALALSMIVVAYTEELFFRAYLPARFRAAGLSTMQAVIVAAMLFSLGHGWQGAPAVGFSLISGLTLGTLWVYKPRIHVLAIGHALYNLVILVLAG
jgi:uncharacterized protein